MNADGGIDSNPGTEARFSRRRFARHARRFEVFRLLTVIIYLSILIECRYAPNDENTTSYHKILYTEDGHQLEATIHPVTGETPPGLILAHRLGSDRSEWDSFAARAQRQGYFCIAFDARGHGRGRMADGRTVSHRDFRDAEWLGMTNDFAAAKNELIERGADPNNLAVIGAELGGSVALFYSRSDPDIRSIVLLSPGRKYKTFDTVAAIREMRKTPILLIASEGDSYSTSSSISLKEAAQGYCELRTYRGSRLGTDILAFSENATAQVFRWLSETLDRAN